MPHTVANFFQKAAMMDIPDFWRKKTGLSYLLLPFSLLFFLITALRRLFYCCGIFSVYRPPVPIIVVGNITVGGNGKTPLVIALAKKYRAAGWQVGIISRGYGGTAKQPQEVTPNSCPQIVGDEPLLIAQKSAAPVFIAAKRAEAAKALLKKYPATTLLISDDGLQHYALARDIEIAAIAADFGLGNGFLLPAGALREPPTRLKSVALTVQIGGGEAKYGQFQLTPAVSGAYPLRGGVLRPFSAFWGQNCYALTAIARPERFFQTLTGEGVKLIAKKSLPDHAVITPSDLDFFGDGILFVSEKDAVKLNWAVALDNIWVIDYQLQIPDEMWQVLQQQLSQITDHSREKD